MFPPKKRHAGSYLSLQTVGFSSQFVSVRDNNGIDRKFPVNDHQMQQVVSIVTGNQGMPLMTTVPSQPTFGAPLQTQSSFGSLTSTTSSLSAFSPHSSQASGLNLPTGRYLFIF